MMAAFFNLEDFFMIDPDPKMMVKTITTFFNPGDTFEVRALDVQGYKNSTQTWSGYFPYDGSNAEFIVSEVLKLPPAKGIYFTVNPVDPSLLARSNNHMSVSKTGSTTSDKDILRRRFMPIDKVTTGMTVSQISKKGWSGLTDIAIVTSAVDILDEQGWVRMVPKANTTGRPTQGIEINPNAMQYLQDKAHYVTEIRVDERPRPWLDHLKNMLEPQPSVDWIMTLQYWQDIMEMDSYEDDDLDAYEDMEAQAALFMLL
jgi:hypothetical protein